MTTAETIGGMKTFRAKGPITAGSVLLRREKCQCLICESPFATGERYTMIPTKPVNDVEHRKARTGQSYVSEFEPAHWDCFVIRLATQAGFMRRRAYA